MYRTIDLEIWGDDKFRVLSAPTPSAQMLWVYLLVGKHTTPIPGVICASVREICGALRWPYDEHSVPDDYIDRAAVSGSHGFAAGCLTGAAAMDEIVKAGMAKSDELAGLIWLPKAILYNPPASSKNVIGWRNCWSLMPNCDLKREIHEAFAALLDERGHKSAFLQACPMPHPMPHQEGEPKSENREQRTENSNKQKKGRAKAHPARREFIDAFHVLFLERTGSKPSWTARHRGLANQLALLAKGDVGELRQRAKRMFDLNGRFPAEHPDLPTLVTHWDKFVSSKANDAIGCYDVDPDQKYAGGEV